jgi:DMSO reductase iron-sulfur subunit
MNGRKAFILDQNKCTGCHACEVACRIENDVPGDRRWRRVRTFNELHVHGVEASHLSLACNHCASAPCIDACPSGAIGRDDAAGVVLIDEKKCIGCRYCAWACPYGAPQFDEDSGVMAKCDFCVERLRSGGRPACVVGCPTGALDWGEMDDGGAEEHLTDAILNGAVSSDAANNDSKERRVPGMALTNARPSIRIARLEKDREAPRQTETPSTPPWREQAKDLPRHVTLAHEWPLFVFTVLMAVLAGLFFGSLEGAPAPNPILFVGAGLCGLLLSTTHLGRKARAWRAPMNARRSWLSREVVFSGAFLALAGLELRSMAGDPADLPSGHFDLSAWLAAACAVAALISADRVYNKAIVRGGGAYHSAELLGTGLLLATVWSGAAILAVLLATIKVALYLYRKRKRAALGLPARPRATAVRLGALLAAGVAAWLGGPRVLVFALVTASEIVDRAEFYDEIEIPTPESLMLDEMASRPQAVRKD